MADHTSMRHDALSSVPMTISPQVLCLQARMLLEQGDGPAALERLRSAAVETSGDAPLLSCYADALHTTGALDEAMTHYRAAVAIDPSLFEAWWGLGCAALERKAYAAAASALKHAAELRPNFGGASYNRGKALFELGEIDAAIACFRNAERDPALRQDALASIACVIPGSPKSDHAAIRDARVDWVATLHGDARRTPLRDPLTGGRRLRIGYFSSFFASQNWMKPVFGVINAHDRTRYEIHMFADGQLPSAEAGYRDHDRDFVYSIGGVSNARVAAAIADARIDVLVDLNGYSAQGRLQVFLQHPAPRVIGWFNMFATTGIAEYDALIGDDHTVRPHEEAYYLERILRVPGSYLAFSVLYDVPPVVPPPSTRQARFTFGCLGSHYKITDEMVACWSRILQACPGADLLLKSRPLSDDGNRAALLARFAQNGITADRLVLEPGAPHREFLEAYGRIDIALDTFPYNGGTTTTEALWQGVPVLTFDGDRWVSRTSASLLHAAGLAGWVMPNQAAYEAQAIALARDPAMPQMLAALRESMRDTLRASPACDSAGLARALEAIYAKEVAESV